MVLQSGQNSGLGSTWNLWIPVMVSLVWALVLLYQVGAPAGEGMADYFLLPGEALAVEHNPHAWCMFIGPVLLIRLVHWFGVGAGLDYLWAHYVAWLILLLSSLFMLQQRLGPRQTMWLLLLLAPCLLAPVVDTNSYTGIASLVYNVMYNRIMDVAAALTAFIVLPLKSGQTNRPWADAWFSAVVLVLAATFKPTYLLLLGLWVCYPAVRRGLRWSVITAFVTGGVLLWVIMHYPGYLSSVLIAGQSRQSAMHGSLVKTIEWLVVFVVFAGYLRTYKRLVWQAWYTTLVLFVVLRIGDIWIVAGNNGSIGSIRQAAGYTVLVLCAPWERIRHYEFLRCLPDAFCWNQLRIAVLMAVWYSVRFVLYFSIKLMLLLIFYGGAVRFGWVNVCSYAVLPGFYFPQAFAVQAIDALHRDAALVPGVMADIFPLLHVQDEIAWQQNWIADLDALWLRNPQIQHRTVFVASYATSILSYAGQTVLPLNTYAAFTAEIPYDMKFYNQQEGIKHADYVVQDRCVVNNLTHEVSRFMDGWHIRDSSVCWQLWQRK